MTQPPYIPIDGRPLKVAVGTRPLDERDWIEIDEHRQAELLRKDELLRTHRREVLAITDAGAAGSTEVLDLLAEFLPRRFPEVYALSPRGVRDAQMDRIVDVQQGHPLESAARLVQEDLCVMSKSDSGTWVLTAACVCAPSRWSLLEKIGRDMAAIHEPVPFYAERVAAPVDVLFDRLAPQKPVWRLNWTMLTDAAGFQPSSDARQHDLSTASDVGQSLFFRVERQTLRRLPASGDILFTIRTYIRTLASLAQVRPGIYADLVATLEQTPGETLDYKGWQPWLEAARTWLRARG